MWTPIATVRTSIIGFTWIEPRTEATREGRTADVHPARSPPIMRALPMCLGVPGQVVETHHEHGVVMGTVDFGGVRRAVCLDHVPEALPGDYVLVHVGFALSRLDAAEARRVFELLAELGQLCELGEAGPPAGAG